MVRMWIWLVVFLGVACSPQIPAYNQPVTVSENDAVWEVRLLRSNYTDTQVRVELEYANRTGASFSLRPENVVLTDTEGGKWVSEGGFPHIPLLQPGQTRKVQVYFSNVVVTEKPLFVHPVQNLVHKEVKFLLKNDGGAPLPGDHKDERWDVSQ